MLLVQQQKIPMCWGEDDNDTDGMASSDKVLRTQNVYFDISHVIISSLCYCNSYVKENYNWSCYSNHSIFLMNDNENVDTKLSRFGNN